MPRQQVNYSKTIIYKIVCNDLKVQDVYVGHTTNFRKRKNSHKCNCQKEEQCNFNVYQKIRINGGWDNWKMLEIEKFPCNDGNEARSRERYWFEQLNANLNTLIPNRGQREYQESVKEKIRDYHKGYDKEYRQKNKDRITEYYEANKDKLLEYKKQWYLKKKALSQQPT